MKTTGKALLVVCGGILSIPTVAALSFLYFQRMVAAEYASGARVSTDGDSLGIPVIGATVAWTALLLLAATVYGGVKFFKRVVRDNAG